MNNKPKKPACGLHKHDYCEVEECLECEWNPENIRGEDDT
jgi:hypothetical protein